MLETGTIFSTDELQLLKAVEYITKKPLGETRIEICISKYRIGISKGFKTTYVIHGIMSMYSWDQDIVETACKIALHPINEREEIITKDRLFWPNFFQNKKKTIFTVLVILLFAIYGICLFIHKAPP